MNVDMSMKEEILKGDFRNEDEDLYVKMLETDTKKKFMLRVGMGTVYILLLIVSLFVV